MGKKGAMPSYATVDDYISAQSEEAKPLLNELRTIINETVPDVVELENYKVPTFRFIDNGKRDIQLMMAAYSKFVSFYPFPSTMTEFSKELEGYKQGKGCIQFGFDEKIPKDLISDIIKFRREEVLKDSE